MYCACRRFYDLDFRLFIGEYNYTLYNHWLKKNLAPIFRPSSTAMRLLYITPATNSRIALKHNCCRNVSQPRSAESQNVNIVQHLPPRTISSLSSKTTYQLGLSFSKQNILRETRAVPWSRCKLGLNWQGNSVPQFVPRVSPQPCWQVSACAALAWVTVNVTKSWQWQPQHQPDSCFCWKESLRVSLFFSHLARWKKCGLAEIGLLSWMFFPFS